MEKENQKSSVENMEEKQNESEPIVNHKTGQTKSQLLANLPVPGPGRTPDTQEQKDKKKAIKQLVAEYKQSLADALPLVSPALIAKAISGDVSAIRELNDVIVEKATKKQDITSAGKPIVPIMGGLTQTETEDVSEDESI